MSGINIRSPGIGMGSDREQLGQIRSYLYQLSEQLNWAFEHVSTGGTTVEIQQVAEQQAQHLDPEATFAAIKSLIIKSADIVNSYYDSISAKLNGLYVAESEFGAYVEKTNAAIEANSKGITQNYQNQQTLNTSFTTGINQAKSTAGSAAKDAKDAKTTAGDALTAAGEATETANGAVMTANSAAGNAAALRRDLTKTDEKAGDALEKAGSAAEDAASAKQVAQDTAAGFGALEAQAKDLQDQMGALNATVISTNAYIKTGLLYEGEDGIPVYGLEIGQTNTVNGQNVFSKFARFSANRLSFYDQNSTEVAWISDYVLHITNAEITGNLYVLNRFRIFYGNGLAFQWIGG